VNYITRNHLKNQGIERGPAAGQAPWLRIKTGRSGSALPGGFLGPPPIGQRRGVGELGGVEEDYFVRSPGLRCALGGPPVAGDLL
jgi:hypothetical protein